jgi:nitroreductase
MDGLAGRHNGLAMDDAGMSSPRPVSQAGLAGLLTRHSLGPRWLVEPGPDAAQLLLATQAALRAPDHGCLRPWRAVVVAPADRTALGDLFARCARDAGKDALYIDAERERAQRGPVLVAWVARIEADSAEVPPNEQWITAGGALTNFLNALHLMGFAAKTLSGRKCGHPLLHRAFCDAAAGETLVGFVCVGTAAKPAQPRSVDDAAAQISNWRPPPIDD